MAFFDQAEAEQLKAKMTEDLSLLGKLYKSKNTDYHQKNIEHNLVSEYLKNGWEEYGTPLATRTKVRKLKSHSEKFEDEIWCQFYKLGFRNLNTGRDYILPFGSKPEEKKQIDVIAVSAETIFIIECKSSETQKKAPSFKTEFEALRQRLDGHRKALQQMYGSDRRIQYLFATKNLRLNRDSPDIKRLEESGGFFYGDSIYGYVERLIANYKSSARYQFFALMFKGQKINDNSISVPALEGKMGGKTYYMFSLEPSILLKIGFVLHRTSANKSEMPTYQRLLVPSRLKGIGTFLGKGGFFPNSILLNFNETKRQKIRFEANPRDTDSNSRSGVLKIPNAYAIAYIIDGQHRVYGYSQSEFKASNTIPVVAFNGLESDEQLEMFMSINQNQKAVSATLRYTLEEDLHWFSSRLDYRLKSLRSSIVTTLGEDISSPLYDKISIGEDKKKLAFKQIADAIAGGGLLPKAKGNKYSNEGKNLSLYDINNNDNNLEMRATQRRVFELIKACYEFAEEQLDGEPEILESFVYSSAASFPFVSLLGSLSEHCANEHSEWLSQNNEFRAEKVAKYLSGLFLGLKNLDDDLKEKILTSYGSGGQTLWLRNFQLMVNKEFPDYDPEALQDWRERQDKAIQDAGRDHSIEIEKHLKSTVISNMEKVYGENWRLEIGSIYRECQKRLSEQEEEDYKNGNEPRNREWTEMFLVTHYRTIISNNWTKKPEGDDQFITFEEHYTISVGDELKTKADKVKWLGLFNQIRRDVSHEGSRNIGINVKDLNLLETIRGQLKEVSNI